MIEGPRLIEDQMPWVGDYAAIGARLCPDRSAIVTPELGGDLTYRELARRVDRAALLLRQNGLQPGDRFAYLGRNSDVFFVVLLAAIRAGVVMVPLNWRCQVPEIEFFLEDSGSTLLFADPAFSATAMAAIERNPLAPRILSTGTGEGGDTGFVDQLALPGEMLEEPVPYGDTVCLLLYTSGTSGRPKGTLCTHRALSIMRQAELVAPDFPKWQDETMVSAMPAFHIAGTSWMLMGLLRRSVCVLTADPSAPNLIKLIREHDAARTFAVPTVIRTIVDEVRRTGMPLPSLKMFFYGAMPIGETLLRDALETLGCGFLQFYGMTEVTGSATFLAPRFHALDEPELMLSVGQPFPGVTVDIRDAEGRPLPPGKPGEIYLRTLTMMTGYWNRPDATEAAFQNGWYRTGDGGRLDERGFLYLTDRIKDMIVSGGENVYPAEVEEILARHPAIQASAVVARPDPRWGEAVAAIIELRPGHHATAEDIIAFTRSYLAGYKCPKSVHFVATLPRTASGKLQRAQAKSDYLAWLAAQGSSGDS